MKSLVALAAAMIVMAAPSPGVGQAAGAQLGAGLGTAQGQQIVAGQRLTGRGRGVVSYTFDGRAGERVSFAIQTDVAADLMIVISPMPTSVFTLGVPTPVHSARGRSLEAAGVLPREGRYSIVLQESTIFPRGFNYTIDFSSSLGGGQVVASNEPAPAAAPASPQVSNYVVPNVGSDVTEIALGQRVEGRAGGGQAAYIFRGVAGQQVTFDLQSDVAGSVRLVVVDRPASRLAIPRVVHNETGGGSRVETVTLPRDGAYTVALTETSLFAKPFNYALTFGNGAPGSGAPVQVAQAPARGPSPAAEDRRITAASAPAPVVQAAPTAETLAPVPAHCRQQACWGGLDQYVGMSFSRLEITIPQTERVTFMWLEPGVVLRLSKDAGGTIINYDFRIDPATGAPYGYTIENGILVGNTAPTEGALRTVHRVVGDRYETEAEEFKRGRWRPWRYFGIRVNTSFRSDQAIQQARQARSEMFGAVMQGAMVVGQAVADGQAEANAQNAELNRLRLLAEEETRQNREREAAAIRAQENERARQVAEAQFAQSRENDARRAAADRQGQARAEEERAAREATQRRQADQRAQEQARQETEAREAREAQAQREAQARAQAAEQQRLAAEQARAARLAEQTRLLDFREGVVLCELSGPQAQFGNWRCTGPLQMTYAKLDSAEANFSLDQACGGGAVRELGTVGSYRAFGCGFGVHPTNPGALSNVPERFGVGFVPGRITFRCPANSPSTCTSR
ncbi:MAG TPA: hypothetical protein VGB49_04380 [Caulobacteraceae bacterium]